MDTGFLCYLNGITQTEQVLKGTTGGPLFETLVLGEILRHHYNRGEIPRIYWWRTTNGNEVDFILERGGKIIPIEIKMTSNVRKDLTKGLSHFIEIFSDSVEESYLVTISGESLSFGKKIKTLPFYEFVKQVCLTL